MCGVGICGEPCSETSLKPRSSDSTNRMFGAVCAAGLGDGGLGGHRRAGGGGSVQPPPQLLLGKLPPGPTAVHFSPRPCVVQLYSIPAGGRGAGAGEGEGGGGGGGGGAR